VARGANVMAGYWNNQQETAGSFYKGFFRTGDIAYQDSRGYFYILDRCQRHDRHRWRKRLFGRSGARRSLIILPSVR
jgi:acyl-CoA synthetase (AMP-forming)/AMP-acid ligase II